jgi:hypothetical protein
MNHYIYIIQLREFINQNLDVYKIGKTQNVQQRKRQYPKNSKLILSIEVDDMHESENHLKHIFKKRFKQCKDYGTEYFEGNIEDMTKLINEYVDNRNANKIDYEELKDFRIKKDTTSVSKSVSKQIVVESPDIDDILYEELLKKQKRDEATEIDKISIDKHHWKRCLGVDVLNEEIIDKFTKESILNFTSLISDENIPHHTDNQTVEMRDRARLITGLINDLGFSHIFDTHIIEGEQFDENVQNIISNNPIFTQMESTKIRFGLEKKQSKMETNKQILGFINTLLSRFHVSIVYKRIKKKGELIRAYEIKILNDINELLEYRIQKGLILHDNYNIRPKPETTTYKHLINKNVPHQSFKEQLMITDFLT